MRVSQALEQAVSHGKQIRLFLVDGSASGIRYAELVNWTGQAFACPKSLFSKLKEWPETQRPGVYALVGVNGEGKEAIYIGESENVAGRLLQHLSQLTLEEIVEAIMFTSKDDNLTKGHIVFLEQRLVKQAQDANRYVLQNVQAPSEKTLSKQECATMEEFLEKLYLVAAAMGYNFFETTRAEHVADKVKDLYVFEWETKRAEGYPSDDGFVVKRGSLARINDTPTLQAGYKALKEDLQSKSVLVANGDQLVFSKDYTFSSSTAAVSVASGAMRSGPKSWKRQSDQKYLRDVESEKAKADEQAMNNDQVLPPMAEAAKAE